MRGKYKTYDDLPLTLNADHIAAALGISRAGAYQLMHRKDFPALKFGKRLVTPKEQFVEWVREQAKAKC